MTNINILADFEREINKIDDTFGKPVVDDSLFWLNQGVNKFIKIRFNGDFVHHTSFEQTEKRRSDLIKLVSSCEYKNDQLEISTDYSDYDKYIVPEYPEDFLYELSETAVITDNEGDHKTEVPIFECTHDSFMYRVNNSLTDFHYKNNKARPLRIRTANGCTLLTDKNYKIDLYTLGYIRKPNEITLDNPHNEYSDFEDITMQEIIKIAAQMYIENQKDERYQTISNEVLTQE